MTYKEAKTLTPEESFVRFAGTVYRFAGLYPKGHLLRKVHLKIYDEPPSTHTDSINISSCSLLEQKKDSLPLK